MISPETSYVENKFNINISGEGTQIILFAHGYGCDQNMFRHIYPAFENDYKVILFDHLGSGKSDINAYKKEQYTSLRNYADDIIEICDSLKVKDIIFVGHSVSSMIGLLAANKRPELFKKMILIGPSPRYINEGDYIGGFDQESIEELLETLDSNYLGWSRAMAPVMMGNSERPELSEELSNSFCNTDPEIAKNFARLTFFSDNREDLEAVDVPCLIIQCKQDIIAPLAVGEYMSQKLKNSTLNLINATGHCPNLSAPEETIKAIKDYI